MRIPSHAISFFGLLFALMSLCDVTGSELPNLPDGKPQPITSEIDARIARLAGIELAKSMRVKKQYRRAIAVLDSVEEKYGKSGELFLARGAIKQQVKLHESAVADLTQAIQMNCHRAEAHAARGTSRFALGDHEGAFDDLDRAVEASPNSPTCFLARGRTRFLNGQYESAIDDFDRLVKLAPKNSSYYTMRASSHAQLGNHDAMVSDATKAIALDPTEPTPFYLRGGANAKLGKWEAALDDYDSLVVMEATAKAYAGRASIHLQIGNHQAAVYDATSALKLDPNLIMAVKIRAVANRELGKMEEASADIELVKKLDRPASQKR